LRADAPFYDVKDQLRILDGKYALSRRVLRRLCSLDWGLVLSLAVLNQGLDERS
jgi:hypothetical protein